MKRERLMQLVIVSIMTITVIALAIGGCSKDCPTCPTEPPVQHYRGWLYYIEENDDSFYGVYRIDMETDSIVDSIEHEDPDMGPNALNVSGDGRFLVITYSDPYLTRKTTRVFDAQTLALIRELPGDWGPLFDTERNLMLGFQPTWTGNYLGLFRLPTFEVIRVDTVGNFWVHLLDAKRGFAYGIADIHGWTHEYPRGLSRYDYLNRKLELIEPVHPSGDTLWAHAFCLNRQGNIVYFKSEYQVVPVPLTGSLVAYDLVKRQILWTYPTPSIFGGVALSPDETEVWMNDPAEPGFGIYDSGTIYTFDARTGAYLEGISLFGYLPWDPASPLSSTVKMMVFSPTGEKAYVATGMNERYTGSVLVVDTKLKQIVKILSPDLKRLPRGLRIGPKI